MAPENRRARVVVRTARHPRGRAAAGLGLLLVAAVLLFSAAAHAQAYVCTLNGRTISGDQPPPECRNVAIRELNPDGSTKRVIAAPMTPEERRRQDQAEQAARDQKEKDRQQHQKDLALLQAYADEKDIVAARDHALLNLQSAVDHAQLSLEEARKERIKLDGEAEFYVKHEVPPALMRKITDNDENQRQQQRTIDRLRETMQTITQRYDADRARFHELMQHGATPRPPSPLQSQSEAQTAERPFGSDLVSR